MSDAGQDVTTRKGGGNTRRQSGGNLTASAEGGCQPAQPAGGPDLAVVVHPVVEAAISANSLRNTPLAATCKVRLKVAVFFDGTGNNLDADVGTKEHSNVARLFRSHVQDDPNAGVYRFYVPGLGTYFREIGDPGDEDGMRFGKRGEPRLQWAMAKLDAAVARHHAVNVTGLDIALFGFSRGATLARAFALRLQERCKAAGGKWLWDKGGFEASVYFMGIFDTVASVFLPASTSLGSLRMGTGWHTIDQGLNARRQARDNGLNPVDSGINLGIAFGTKPGANPTPGVFDGHGDWASDLRIPPLVAKCLHLVAGNEVRNSFPLDSARDGQQYPPGVEERVYPGVHSDVGGGYRPGEGGKSREAVDLLSIVPLRAMHDAALAAGVPLRGKTDDRLQGDFDASPALLDCFNAFIRYANSLTIGQSVEARFLTYQRLYYAWRFKRIRERSGGQRPDAAGIRSAEATFQADSAQLDKDISAAERDPARLQAQADLKKAESDLQGAKARLGVEASRQQLDRRALAAAKEQLHQAEASAAAAREQFSRADDTRMKLLARKTTLPGGGLIDRLDAYDRHLLLDVQAIQQLRKIYPSARLRPHYANLIEAYENEYEHLRGLLDDQPQALALFDHYVHDSLAGFAKDQTLPSDPRVIYIGADNKSPFALDDTQAAGARAA